VDEVARRVVADAAATEANRRGAQRRGTYVGQPDVDGAALQVQAARRDARTALAQQAVRARGAVAGDDLVGAGRARGEAQLVQDVEQRRVAGAFAFR